MTKLQGELDKLNVTLKQVEKYNEEMKGEIALNRRATYKAEEIVQGMERSKRQQDYELEELNSFILDLQKQLNLCAAAAAAAAAVCALRVFIVQPRWHCQAASSPPLAAVEVT